MSNALERWAPRFAVLAALWPVLLSLAWLFPLPAALHRPGSLELRYDDGSAAWVSLSADEQWRVPVALDQVDPDYIRALVQLEDARFWEHPGVDPLAVMRAAAQNLGAGRVLSGASTLTMQVARMAEPRDRTLLNKVRDALRATQIDLRQPKATTLSQYVTMVPFGRNVQGVEAASLWMFGHTAQALSAAEIATLLAIPQDPNDRYPCARNRDRLRIARDAVAERIFTGETLETVRRTPVPDGFSPVPRDVPHAATYLGAAPGSLVATTLDRGVQRVADRVLRAASSRLHQHAIHNGTVVVVEHVTGRIVGLAGLDGLGSWAGSQIPPFDQPRSPGSTLKPLLYGLALDRGLAIPATLVADVPARYGAYAPENYDRDWAGMLRLDEALSRSLNVPFVNLLSQYGVERFLAALRRAGVGHLNPTPGHYGLSAVVGGMEVSALELAALYTAVAGDGRVRPLTLLDTQRPLAPIPLLSPGAAWLTRETLRLRDRPDFPSRAALAQLPLRIHWKTGTSFGNRDAWAVGSGARYTVVVWLGNLDQTPAIALVGADVAAPMLFDVLEGLGDGVVEDDLAPEDVEKVEVCALSGALAGQACPKARAHALVGHAPHLPCGLHQTILIEATSGSRVQPNCATGRPVPRVVVAWPGAVSRFLQDRLQAEARMPAWSPQCSPTSAQGPRIHSPAPTQHVLLIPGLAAEAQEIGLEGEGEGELAWYVDGALIARGPASERQWWAPIAGHHTLTVMDRSGASVSQPLTVQNATPPSAQ